MIRFLRHITRKKFLINFSISVLVLGLSLIVYFYAGSYWAPRQRLTGDEPHYLIITQSMVADHDLDLTNNYAQKDYQAWNYVGETMDPHVSINSQNGKQYSFHNPGWPLVLYYPYKWWGFPGARGTAIVIGALLALNIFLLIKKITRKSGAAWLVFLATAFSVPFVIYATQLYNEMLAALLICFAVLALYTRLPNFFSQFFSIAAISFLPWVHVKYIWVSLFLFLIWLFINLFSNRSVGGYFRETPVEERSGKAETGHEALRKRRVGWLGRLRAKVSPHASFPLLLSLLYLASGALLSYLFHRWYGSYLPNAQYPAGLTLIQTNQIGAGTLGLLLDRHFGLLPYAPIYVFSLAGLIYAFIKDRLLGILLSGAFLTVFLQHAASTNLLGWAPEGRFWVAILPMLAVSLGLIYPLMRTWNKVIFYMAASWGWIAGYFLIRHPDLNYAVSEPKYLAAISSKLIDFTRFFPHIITMDQPPVIRQTNLIIIWGTIILVLTVLTLVFRARELKTKSRSSNPK